MFECKFCKRKFIGKRALNNHQLEHNEERIIPNNFELWNIIKELIKNHKKIRRKIKHLVKKNELYEQKIRDLTKKVGEHNSKIIKLGKKKGKVDILDWLNTNCIEGVKSFLDWRKSWIITNEQMEFLLENKYVNGIANILKENLETEDIYPVRSFKRARNFMYIFDGKKWRLMIDKDYMALIAGIQVKIAGAFLRWQDLNPEIVNNDKDGKYEIYMREAFGGKRKKEVTDKLINKKLFDLVRIKESEL